MSEQGKKDQDHSNENIAYEVDETEDEQGKHPARSSASDADQRPAESLMGAERDLRAKQSARAQMSGGTAARPTTTSRLMRMEEDALSKARSRGGTTPSVPGAVAATPPPASLRALEEDLEAKHRAYNGRNTAVKPSASVTSTTAAAEREHGSATAADANARMSNSRYAKEDPDHQQHQQQQHGDPRRESGRNEANAISNMPPSANYTTRPTEPTVDEENPPVDDEESGDVGDPTLTEALITATVQPTAHVTQMAEFHTQGSFDDSTAVAEVAPIEAFVAQSNVVDAAGVAPILSQEEEKELEDRKLRRWMIWGAIGLIIVIVVIVVPTVVVLGKNSKHEPTPTMAPSTAPSLAPTLTPTGVSFPTLESKLAPYSGSAVLLNRTTPQYAALKWMSENKSDVLTFGDDQLLQLYSMTVFYFALNGDKWTSCNRIQSGCTQGTTGTGNTGWLSTTDPCSWYAITCVDGKIQRVQFTSPTGNGLSGSLPFELFLTTTLQSLIINTNSISGTIPNALDRLANLTTLYLPQNRLTGTIPTVAFAKATQLQSLFLFGNELNGTIPSTLASLPLQDLRLSGNQLTGPIPSQIGSMSSLGVFIVNNNLLTGTVPTQIFSLPRLITLMVNSNQKLKGTIPTTVAFLTNVKSLFLGNTQIGGSLPEGLFNLLALSNLQLNNAQFTGTLSVNFGNLNQTTDLNLSFNKFRGTIPTTFALLNHLNFLELEGNNLTGTVPAVLCNRTGLQFYDLHNISVDCNEVKCQCCGCT